MLWIDPPCLPVFILYVKFPDGAVKCYTVSGEGLMFAKSSLQGHLKKTEGILIPFSSMYTSREECYDNLLSSTSDGV